MLDKDTYKRELVRMWNTLRDDRYKTYNACNGVSCNKCPLNGIGCSEPLSSYEVVEIVKKWAKENPLKKYKVSKLEYDILQEAYSIYGNFRMYQDELINNLREKGYFKGSNEGTDIEYYLKNCEVA